ncbi:ribonuclease P protein component [Tateyamaria sp. Alg231-49]|uniref:ribonuclease P protein component n=1 Tax=Tateyamaria sp. Alg231-49 TaxID=1922219 RepID=UPI000D54B4DD|nr:ribonuclease P protein component [Tateyamaria sp. Alg231-49]
MIPPEAPLPNDAVGQGTPPAGHLRLEILKARADFLRAARAKRVVTPGFVLQYRPRDEGDVIRVGFTCSKKVGNAVARNRAKRRLREIARLVLPEHGSAGMDYVLIGRAEVTANRPFDVMLDDLRQALSRAT